MKPLLINTFDTGGAGKACMRLHKGLLKAGVSNKVLVKVKRSSNPTVYEAKLGFQGKLHAFLQSVSKRKSRLEQSNYLLGRDRRLELFSFPNGPFKITDLKEYQSADIINLHWVARFMDYEQFFRNNKKPVVWTMHDVNPFSGGEHYNEVFLGMDENGFPRKRGLSSIDKEIQDQVLALKAAVLAKVDNLTIVVLCEWMAKELRENKLARKFPIKIIPNGIDASIFRPKDREASRKALELPLDKKIILFVADTIENERKGFRYLERAFERLERDNVLLCAVGRIPAGQKLPMRVVNLGVIKDEHLMATAYSAADVFVIPSLMDNLPNTVVESHMCGTPVIGFPVGGIANMITHSENGILTKEVSVGSLQEALVEFLEGTYQFNRDKIRATAMQIYSAPVQAEAYKKLFQEIMDEHKGA